MKSIYFKKEPWNHHKYPVFLLLQLYDVFLYQKVRGGAMQDIKWRPSFSQNVDCFFNTSSVSWASRNSRLRRAIPSAHQMHNYQNHEQEYHLIF